jgi:hypothetical protein
MRLIGITLIFHLPFRNSAGPVSGSGQSPLLLDYGCYPASARTCSAVVETKIALSKRAGV